MASHIYGMLNQYYYQGCNAGQQGMMAEANGNIPSAAQLYDQSIMLITNSVTLARQYGVFVPDPILFTLAFSHYCAARVKGLLGWTPAASGHLAQSLDTLNQAIAINPNLFQYHGLAGTVLVFQGNLPEAERAFRYALHLNPMDPWSQWMLGFIQAAQGNMAAANQYYTSAVQQSPRLPPIPNMAQQFGSPVPPGGGRATAESSDWLHTITEALKFANNLFQVVESFQNPTPQWPF